MLLLGVLAAQAEGAVAAAGSYDLLETEILTGTQASVTFSSLNSTYGADYQHLQLRMVAQSAEGGTGSGGVVSTLSFNSSAMTKNHYLYANGSTVASGVSGTSGFLVNLVRSGSTDAFSACVADILDPFNSSKNTTVRWLGGYPNELALSSNLWNSTTAVDSITVGVSVGNYSIGSRFSLYGLRSA